MSIDPDLAPLDAVGALGMGFDVGAADDDAAVAPQSDGGLAALEHDFILRHHLDSAAIDGSLDDVNGTLGDRGPRLRCRWLGPRQDIAGSGPGGIEGRYPSCFSAHT